MSNAIDFRMSRNAKEKITELVNERRASLNKDVVPAVMWIDAGLNQGKVASQPAIGFYTDRREIEDDIVVIDGLEVVFAVSEEDIIRFSGKILDYENDQFFLRTDREQR